MNDKKVDRAIVASVREATLIPAVSYPATEEQRRVKAKFWIEFRANPLVDKDAVTPNHILDLVGYDVSKWMGDSRFWSWFASTNDTIKENLEIAAEKASELALYYLDPSTFLNDNARVQLIKYVLEFAGRTPPTRKEIKWHDKEIADLSHDQLDALISKLQKTPTPTKE